MEKRSLSKPNSKKCTRWLVQDKYLDEAIQKVNESFNNGIPRVTDPLYCKKDKDGKYFAFDGNGRVLYALLNNIPKVRAYVGYMDGNEPANYWIYTMFLLNLSALFRNKVLTLGEYKKILLTLFNKSHSAVVEYRERVPDDQETKELILSDYGK